MMNLRMPMTLLVPSVTDFTHGDWFANEGLDDTLAALVTNGEARQLLPTLRYDCDTQCCLVGWAAMAFDERGCQPDHIDRDETVAFLKQLLELAGVEVLEASDYAEDVPYRAYVADRASDVFEGFEEFEGQELEPKRAHELWTQAASKLGYDVSNVDPNHRCEVKLRQPRPRATAHPVDRPSAP